MEKAKSGAHNSTAKGQREKGKEKDRSSSVETHSVKERKRVMMNCTNNCMKQSATVHYLSRAYRQQPMYLYDRRTPTLIPTDWNQSSNPPPRFALVENCGFLNCLHRFLFLSRRRSKKLITVRFRLVLPRALVASSEPNFLCFLDWIVLFLRPGVFFSFYSGRTFSFRLLSLFHAFHGRVRKISPRICNSTASTTNKWRTQHSVKWTYRDVFPCQTARDV